MPKGEEAIGAKWNTPRGAAEIHDQDRDNFRLQALLINANNSSEKQLAMRQGCQERHPGDLGFSSCAISQLRLVGPSPCHLASLRKQV